MNEAIKREAQQVKELGEAHIKLMDNLPIKEILSLDQPWPLPDVLDKLIEASESLLDRGYDKTGWEEIYHAIKRGKEISALFKPQN